MHRIAQIVDGKLDTPLVFPLWDDRSCDRRKGHGFLAGER